jgi:hypothetical protein
LSTLPFWGRNGPNLSGDLLLGMSDKRPPFLFKKLYNILMHLHQYITIELESAIIYKCAYRCGWEKIIETDNTGDLSYSA